MHQAQIQFPSEGDASGHSNRREGKCSHVDLVFGQWWPVFFFLHVFLTGVISGALNAGIAVAMYRGQDNIRLWYFPRTLAGDAAVTIFVQCILGWLIDGMMSYGEFQKGLLPPFPRVATKIDKSAVGRFFLNHSLQLLKGAKDIDPTGRHPKTWRFRRIFGGIFRSIVCGVVIFPPFWGAIVGIAAGVWGNSSIDDTPGPQIFKGLEGFALGFLGSIFVVAQCAKFGDGVNPPHFVLESGTETVSQSQTNTSPYSSDGSRRTYTCTEAVGTRSSATTSSSSNESEYCLIAKK